MKKRIVPIIALALTALLVCTISASTMLTADEVADMSAPSAAEIAASAADCALGNHLYFAIDNGDPYVHGLMCYYCKHDGGIEEHSERVHCHDACNMCDYTRYADHNMEYMQTVSTPGAEKHNRVCTNVWSSSYGPCGNCIPAQETACTPDGEYHPEPAVNYQHILNFYCTICSGNIPQMDVTCEKYYSPYIYCDNCGY